MIKHVKNILVMILCACFVLCMCGCDRGDGGKYSLESRIIQEAKLKYHSSTYIVFGTCTERTATDNKKQIYSVTISQVVAGDIKSETSIKCTGADMTVNNEYLLFISDDSVIESDEMIFSATAYQIVGNNCVWDNARNIDKNVLSAAISAYSSIVFAPTTTYYYSDVQSLLNDTDVILIGKIVNLSDSIQINVKSQSSNVYMENTENAYVADILVYGSIKGDFIRNDSLKMVCTLSSVLTMTDALTVSTVAMPQSSIPSLDEEGMCLFFLVNNPDEKQAYYFPINPVQGWINIKRNEVIVGDANTPFLKFNTLTHLITYINVETEKIKNTEEQIYE